jgi:hypothetical protein
MNAGLLLLPERINSRRQTQQQLQNTVSFVTMNDANVGRRNTHAKGVELTRLGVDADSSFLDSFFAHVWPFGAIF